MPWFKVDDGFYDHPKVLGLDVAAVGLWVLAGSYCARHLTDGCITDKQIRAIGGTRRQAEKLVASGLWSSDGAPLSVRRYFFDDWRDFQPTRADVLAERQRARDRMAEARAKRRAASENAEMFGRTTGERSPYPERSDYPERSPYPDPTRPDPTNKGVGVVAEVTAAREPDPAPSQISDSGDRSAAAPGATPADWSTPDDPRCRDHAGLPRDQVPACRGCADARRWFTSRADSAANARRVAIAECPVCDERGFVQIGEGHDARLAKCDHTGRRPPVDPPPVFVPQTDAKTRQRALQATKRANPSQPDPPF